MTQTTTPAALDLAKLEALARAAKREAKNPRIQDQCASEYDLVAAVDADTVLALIDLARRSSSAAGSEQDERAMFESALKETWKMVDPYSKGQPGSYAKGEQNGMAAALKTIKENFSRAAQQAAPEAPASAQPVAAAPAFYARQMDIDAHYLNSIYILLKREEDEWTVPLYLASPAAPVAHATTASAINIKPWRDAFRDTYPNFQLADIKPADAFTWAEKEIAALREALAQQGAAQDVAANAGEVVDGNGIRGPLTDAQRDECRTLYNNLKHLQSGGYYVADDVIRQAAGYGYMNGWRDFGPATIAGASQAAHAGADDAKGGAA